MIILPRQAWDRDRENSKGDVFSYSRCGYGRRCFAKGFVRWLVPRQREGGAENAFFCAVLSYKSWFYQEVRDKHREKLRGKGIFRR